MAREETIHSMPGRALIELAEVIRSGMDAAPDHASIQDRTRAAIDGVLAERFDRPKFERRVVFPNREDDIAFAGLLPTQSPATGVYGGMSLCWFPIGALGDQSAGSLLTFVCGTRGLAPDEQILGRPGHARALSAMRR